MRIFSGEEARVYRIEFLLAGNKFGRIKPGGFNSTHPRCVAWQCAHHRPSTNGRNCTVPSPPDGYQMMNFDVACVQFEPKPNALPELMQDEKWVRSRRELAAFLEPT